MSRIRNLTGQRFGRLMVIGQDGKRDKAGSVMWDCSCSCGKTVIVSSGNLVRGNTSSCGCARVDYREHAHSVGLKRKDLVGKRFGKLVVVSFDRTCEERHRTFWNCVCDCGEKKSIRGDSLKSGKVVSCGCYGTSRIGLVNRSHGFSQTRLYNKYQQMLKRCYSSDSVEYSNYGGRGIYVCDRWLGASGFLSFLEDMGECPEGKSIDRINNEGPYSPDNCRWASKKEQARNRRGNVFLEYNGERKCMSEWCELFNLPYQATRSSINSGASLCDVVGGSR